MATVARRTTTTSMLHHSAAARSRPVPRPGATAPAGAGGREPPHFPRAPNPLERGPMAPDGDERVKIVVYYAVWATACALVAGAAISAIHTAFFSYHPGRSGAARTLVGDLAAAAALAAGQ